MMEMRPPEEDHRPALALLEHYYQSEVFTYALTGAEATGAILLAQKSLGFKARACIVTNTSKHTFDFGLGFLVPPGVYGVVFLIIPPRDIFSVTVQAAAAGAGVLMLTLTEQQLGAL